MTWVEPPPIPADRVEALLATRRVAPSNRRMWQARLAALSMAKRRGPEELHERIGAEMRAMWDEQDAARDRAYERTKSIRRAEEAAMLGCKYRHPLVRGLTDRQCKAKRMCFLCAGPLPPRRMWWCSDRCVNLWTQNHEWSAASHAARRRDGGKCVRCGSDGGDAALEVNHKRPRNGRGYHQGCHHHQVRLETLCHPCHVIETTRQGRERRAVAASPPMSVQHSAILSAE